MRAQFKKLSSTITVFSVTFALLSLGFSTDDSAHVSTSLQPAASDDQDGESTADPGHDTRYLNDLFSNASKDEHIRLRPDSYKIEGHVVLPQSDNVTIDARGSEFQGKAIFLSAATSGLTWEGGSFVGDGTHNTRISFVLLKTENSSFSDMNFDRTTPFGDHVFDLLGCTDTTIQQLVVTGYGHTPDTSELPPHSLYAEAIQVDFAAESGLGKDVDVDLLLNNGGEFDGSPTSGLKVVESVFQPKRAPDGSLVAWAPPAFGNHSPNTSDEVPSDLTFSRNVVVDSVPTIGLSNGPWNGALHIGSVSGLDVSRNYFEFSEMNDRHLWIEVGTNPPHSEDAEPSSAPTVENISVRDNVFAGSPPRTAYMALGTPLPAKTNSSTVQVSQNRLILGNIRGALAHLLQATGRKE